MTGTILPMIHLEKTPHCIPNLSIFGDPSAVGKTTRPNSGGSLLTLSIFGS
jgi:hypothetical protein